MATTTQDVERVQEIIGTLRGAAISDVEAALAENREGVIRLAEETARNNRLTNPPAAFVASVRKGEHRRMRAVSTDEGTGPSAPARIPAEQALRRLYDAKVEQLAQYGVREPDRIMIAVDYACSEIWRCHIGPLPPGGIGKLEDDLYRAIGCDRFTGLRFAPRTPGETHA